MLRTVALECPSLCSPFSRVFNVVWTAFQERRRRAAAARAAGADAGALSTPLLFGADADGGGAGGSGITAANGGSSSSGGGGGGVHRSPSLAWLDGAVEAAPTLGGKTFSTRQVEEVKLVLRMLPIFGATILYWTGACAAGCAVLLPLLGRRPAAGARLHHLRLSFSQRSLPCPVCFAPAVYMQVSGEVLQEGRLGGALGASHSREPGAEPWPRLHLMKVGRYSQLHTAAIFFFFPQMGSFFVEQGAYMKRDIALPGGGTFTIPSASLGCARCRRCGRCCRRSPAGVERSLKKFAPSRVAFFPASCALPALPLLTRRTPLAPRSPPFPPPG